MKIDSGLVVKVDGIAHTVSVELTPVETPIPVPPVVPPPIPVPPPVTPPPVVPPTGLITDKLPHPMMAFSRPAKGESYTDPQFGTKITRLTDAGAGGVIKPAYSTAQAWNADESNMILYSRVGGGHHELYNGQPPYNFIKKLGISPVDIEQFYWHPTDPDILFYPSTDWAFVRYHVSTGQKEVLHQFPKTGAYAYADSHGFMSWDGKHIGLKIKEGAMTAYIYHLDSDTLSSAPLPTPDDRGMLMSASGQYAYWNGSIYTNQLSKLYDLDLNNDQNRHEHACLARYADGTETYNTVSFDGFVGIGDRPALPNNIGSLVVHELVSRKSRVIVGPATGYPYPASGTHVSAVAFKNPGWIALSGAGNGLGQSLLDNEILLVNTSPDQEVVYRIAHSRTTPKDDSSLGYWSEAHPTISPTGTRVIFASDWGNSGQVDTYVIELPSYH